LELELVADPRFIVLGWVAGLAAVTGLVSSLKIVGPGFTWLVGGFATALGLVGLAFGSWSRLAFGIGVIALLLAKRQAPSGALFVAASLGYLADAASLGGWILATTAAVALGGVTGEMALGHWYLVDPRLPRWALRVLAVIGIVGLVADAGALAWVGELTSGGPLFAFLGLLVMSLLLMVGVLGALRHPAYSGVMAATGLSYLAVLTTLGAVFLGRALIAGMGPFAS
jgi:hypothetical protein